MSVAFVFNIILIVLLVAFVAFFIIYKVKKTGPDEDSRRSELERTKEKYSIASMQAFIKKQFDEITRMNLYDLALSEEEFERRQNVKYELKKALKGAGYADASEKKYVKTCYIYIKSNLKQRHLHKLLPNIIWMNLNMNLIQRFHLML